MESRFWHELYTSIYSPTARNINDLYVMLEKTEIGV